MILVDELRSRAGNYVGQTARAEHRGAKHDHMWCRLVATEGETELQAFAERLHLRSTWSMEGFYYLTPPRRRRAVNLGAVEVTSAVVSKVLASGAVR